MKINKDIKPVTYLKNHAAEVIHQVNETHRPMIITQNGLPKAVIQDAESYEELQEALALLRLLAQSEEDIRHGRVVPLAKARTMIKIKSKNKSKK